MKITDSLGSSSGDGDEDERRQIEVELKGEDSDDNMMDIEILEVKELEQLNTTSTMTTGNSQVNWASTDNYTNGRGGTSYRGSRGGNRMRGLGDGGGRGRGVELDTDQGYQGSYSPFHITNLSSASSSPPGHEEQQGNGQNGNGGGQEFREALTQLAVSINSGFVYLNTAMEQLRQGQLELYDAKFQLEKICWRNGVHPEFPNASVLVEESTPFISTVDEGRGGRGDVSGRGRRAFPRVSFGGKARRKQDLVEFSLYNSQLSKEGLPKLIKRLDSTLNLKAGPKRSKKYAAVVLDDIGNRVDMEKPGKLIEEHSGKDSVEMEDDVKIVEDFEDDYQDEEEEERRRRKKRKENLPHWRQLRVDPPVMERIMKRLREFNSSGSMSTPPPASQSQSSSESSCFNSSGGGGGGGTQGAGEEKIGEEKIGEEN